MVSQGTKTKGKATYKKSVVKTMYQQPLNSAREVYDKLKAQEGSTQFHRQTSLLF